jgi:pyruvate,orthophosphate dikinase
MFLGDRRPMVEALILADTDEEREQVLADLLPLQRADFAGIFEAMDGLPVTIRLLDPPLHEFLPDFTELSVRVAVAEARGEAREGDLRLLQAVLKLHEQNPMLGLRGVRLGLVIPGLFAMQARAVLEAAAARVKAGGVPRAEIMVPLVGAVQELESIAEDIVGRGPRGPHGLGRAPRPYGGNHDRAAPGGPDRRGDRRSRRVLLLRHQRPDPDDMGLLPGRCGGGFLLALPGEGHLRRLAVRVPGPGRCRAPCEDRRRGRPQGPPRAEGRGLR